MNISNTTFFHVSSKRDWVVGQSYNIGAEYSDRYQELMGRAFVQQPDGQNYMSQYALFEGMALYLQTGQKPQFVPGNYHFDSSKALLETVPLMRSSLNMVREMFFENMRMEKFPDKISRLKSIHVIPAKKEDLAFWLPQLKFPGAVIYKLETAGRYHRADQRFLDNTMFTFEDTRKKAEAYWTEKEDVNTQMHEWIFQGTVRVLEIVDRQRENAPTQTMNA